MRLLKKNIKFNKSSVWYDNIFIGYYKKDKDRGIYFECVNGITCRFYLISEIKSFIVNDIDVKSYIELRIKEHYNYEKA